MNKVNEILQSFRNQFLNDDELEEVANERLEVCKGCPHFKKSKLGIHICDKCNCSLMRKGKPFGKPYSPSNSCPCGKWKR